MNDYLRCICIDSCEVKWFDRDSFGSIRCDREYVNMEGGPCLEPTKEGMTCNTVRQKIGGDFEG